MEEKNSYLSADPETIRQIDEKMPPGGGVTGSGRIF